MQCLTEGSSGGWGVGSMQVRGVGRGRYGDACATLCVCAHNRARGVATSIGNAADDGVSVYAGSEAGMR